MTITAEQVYLLNNKMGRVASNVQLGTLIQNAETISAGEVALATGDVFVGVAGVATAVPMTGDVTISQAGVTAIGAGKVLESMVTVANGKVLIGNASNVAVACTLSGDVTTTNAGVTAIGAGKVTEAMLVAPGTAGLMAQRRAYAVFDPSATSGERTIAAHALTGVTIPNKAFVTGIWYWVETTFTSATDAATVALSIEGANDVISAIAISDVSNPWDTTAKPVEGITKIETTSSWLLTTAARSITATVAIEALTAGRLHIWADYMVHN